MAATDGTVTPPPPVTSTTSGSAQSEDSTSPTTTTTTSPPPANPQSPQPIRTESPTPDAISEDPVVTTPQPGGHPQVVALRSMFPDFDDLLLQSVLESVNWDQDRAVDVLLGMSDPEYKSDAPPVQQQPERPMTQEELDEQLARRLLLEDQERQQRYYQELEWSRPGPVRSATHPGPQQKDTMAELGEQFSKFAESGKKTFGDLFSKVKAKVQEFDHRMQNPPASSSSTHAGAVGGPVGGDTYPYDADQNPFPGPAPRPISATKPASPQSYNPPAMQGYDAGTSSTHSSSPPSAAHVTPPPPSTGTGTGIDGGKIGLLPKRPVSLLRTSPPPVDTNTKPPARKDTDDELEYVENPFEVEGKK